MGRLAKVLDFLRIVRNGDNYTNVSGDPGGGANITSNHYSSPGDDSNPLKNDLHYIGSIEKTGKGVVLGYLDVNNVQITLPGEKRIYARNDVNGLKICDIWLKNDGSIAIMNDNGIIELKVNGDIDMNGSTFKTNGVIEANSLILNGKEIDGHNHNQGDDSAGDVQLPTGPNL